VCVCVCACVCVYVCVCDIMSLYVTSLIHDRVHRMYSRGESTDAREWLQEAAAKYRTKYRSIAIICTGHTHTHTHTRLMCDRVHNNYTRGERVV